MSGLYWPKLAVGYLSYPPFAALRFFGGLGDLTVPQRGAPLPPCGLVAPCDGGA
jgi:hypothetical protein